MTNKKEKKGKSELIEPRLYPKGGHPGYSPSYAEIECYAKELIEFVQDEEIIKVLEFPVSTDLSIATYKRWLDEFPVLADAHAKATFIVGSRREKFALKGKYDKVIVLKTMAMYDPEYKKNLEWEAKLRNRDEEKNATKIIVLERYPETERVPSKE
jgi:hypothetical protein